MLHTLPARDIFSCAEKLVHKPLDEFSVFCYYTPCQEKPLVCAGEPVAIAKKVHPFPSRTRKLSSSAPMILWGQPHGKIGRRRFTRPHGRFFLFPGGTLPTEEAVHLTSPISVSPIPQSRRQCRSPRALPGHCSEQRLQL